MEVLAVFVFVVAAASISGANSLLSGEYAKDKEGNFVVKVEKDNEFLCIGCIIDPQWVLTTAHCLSNENITISAGSNHFSTFARLSETSLQSRLVPHKNYYIVHPNYTSQDFGSENIGLVYIEQPFNFTTSPRVAGIWLPPNAYKPKAGKIFSWGERFYIYPIAATLHITNVSEVNGNDYCNFFGLQPQKPYLMCSSGHSSPCYLDEGSPLVATTSRGLTVVGIINKQMRQEPESYSCTNKYAPTHYTSVPFFAKWILDAITDFAPTRDLKRTTSTLNHFF